MATKASPKPALILERLAERALMQRALHGGNDNRRYVHAPLIRVGETYNRMVTETEKKILTDLKSEDILNVRADAYGF